MGPTGIAIAITISVSMVALAACGSGSTPTTSVADGADAGVGPVTVPSDTADVVAPPATGRPVAADGRMVESMVGALETSARVDLDATGNRVILGPAQVIGTDPVALQLPDGAAAWITPVPGHRSGDGSSSTRTARPRWSTRPAAR